MEKVQKDRQLAEEKMLNSRVTVAFHHLSYVCVCV